MPSASLGTYDHEERYNIAIHNLLLRIEQEFMSGSAGHGGPTTVLPPQLCAGPEDDGKEEPLPAEAPTGFVIALWDDESSDYKACEGRAKPDCIDRVGVNGADDLSCVWAFRDGKERCNANSLLGVEAIVDSMSDGDDKVIFGRLTSLRDSKHWKAELKTAEKIQLVYNGHGPEALDFGQITGRFITYAPLLKEMIARSYGCKTFAPKDAPQRFANGVRSLIMPPNPNAGVGTSEGPGSVCKERIDEYEAELARIRKLKITGIGNQLHSFDQVIGGKTWWDSADKQQTPISVSVDMTLLPRNATVKIIEYYECRTKLKKSEWDRHCHVASRDEKLESQCYRENPPNNPAVATATEICTWDGDNYYLNWKP